MSLRTRTSALPAVSSRRRADPDRPGAAAARGPDDLDLAAGQAGADRRRAGGVPGAELRRLVRGRRQRRRRPRRSRSTRTIAGREVVFWRNADGALVAGPGACPHLGALLDRCPVLDGTMYCRWHGLALTAEGDRTWSPYRAHDDGVLIWVGLPTEGETPTDGPPCPRGRR